MRIIILPLLLMLFALLGCSFNNGGIIKREKIVVGFDESFAPLGFRNDKGEIVGFDIDLAKEAARRLGVEVEFKPINWAKKKEEITSGNVDILWNGCDITEERKEYMIFSKPYMDSRQVFLIKKGNDQGIYSEYDLKGKVIGVRAGTSSETYLSKNIKKDFAEFKIFNSLQEGFAALDKGEIDVFITDEIAGRYEINQNPNRFEVIEVNIIPATEFGIGFAKDNIKLRDKFQVVFDEMIQDGTAKKISEKWFNADLIKLKR